MPVSLTLNSMCEFTRCSTTWTLPPFGVNLTALLSRFQNTCCRRAGIAGHDDARRVEERFPAARLLPAPRARSESSAPSTIVDQRDLLDIEPEAPGHDAAQVEQVVDQAHLRARIALDDLHGPR